MGKIGNSRPPTCALGGLAAVDGRIRAVDALWISRFCRYENGSNGLLQNPVGPARLQDLPGRNRSRRALLHHGQSLSGRVVGRGRSPAQTEPGTFTERRGWDLNPRTGCPVTSLAGRPDRPDSGTSPCCGRDRTTAGAPRSPRAWFPQPYLGPADHRLVCRDCLRWQAERWQSGRMHRS